MIRPLVLTKKLKLAFEVKDINIARCVGNNNNNNYHLCKGCYSKVEQQKQAGTNFGVITRVRL